MRVLYSVGSLEQIGPAVCAASTFDGVHRGHAALAHSAAELAERRGVLAVALVIWEGERSITSDASGQQPGGLLTLLDERLALLEDLGAFDVALVLSPPPDAPALTNAAVLAAVERVAQPVALLRLAGEPGMPATADAEALHWSVIHAPDDVPDDVPGASLASLSAVRRDGRDLAAGPGDEAAATDWNIPEPGGRDGDGHQPLEHARADGRTRDARTRSEQVAGLLLGGDVRAAEARLGHPYRVGGVVVSGDRRGRLLGYPTANLRLDARKILPADGIYAVWAQLPGEHSATHPAVVSLGVRPQFGAGKPRLLEVYLLDAALDLYGLPLVVEFVERLREERRFTDVEALKAQMALDVERARKVLRESADVGPHPPLPEVGRGRGLG
ncbi:MAG TPA: riboflavin kinase [Ktedonobacterales bacterium]